MVKPFDLGKNGRYFRTQSAKGYLHTYFERNHYSNLNPNIFLLMDLTFDLDPGFFFNVLLLDETNTLVAVFFKSVHKQIFHRVRSVFTSQGQTV